MKETNKQSISDILYHSDRIQSDFESAILEAGIDFESIHWDSYDNSLEINGVEPSVRLSDAAQTLIANAGFSKVYVNHVDKWETHYNLTNLPAKGWRVSYPHNRGPNETGIWVESKPSKWPEEWFNTGKAIVKSP